MLPTVKDIKKAQKESLILKEVSILFLNAVQDDPRLEGLSINRVELSPDKGICYIYFYTDGGPTEFKEKLELLKLYKPSMRKALAQKLQSRYTPELVFKFDTQREKQIRIEELLDTLKEEGEL